jgi:hypothetical protein
MSQRFCRACGKWHDLDAPWPQACIDHFRATSARSDLARPMIIGDLKEYRAAAVDKATGKRPVIGGRRQHREFLKNNGYFEMGNEMPTPKREHLSQKDRVADIKRAIGE